MIFIVSFIGAVVASFCCVVGERFILKESFLTGRSQCNYCRENVRVIDLIPVVSYAFLRGKSRCCGQKIPVEYVCVELFVGISWAFAYMKWGISIESIGYALLTCLLSIITITDLRAMIIPNKILGCFFLFFILFYLGTNQLFIGRFVDSFLMFLFFIFIVFFQKEGIGGGDIKLFILLTFILGLYKAMLILLFSCAFALAISFLAKKKRGQPVIFGPMIAFVTIGSALCETMILKVFFPFWYL